jgi:hypothetical protein
MPIEVRKGTPQFTFEGSDDDGKVTDIGKAKAN